MKFLPVLLLVLLFSTPAIAFMEGGCGAGKCADCHSLTVAEANRLLGDGVDRVLRVEEAEMPGVWAVEVEKNHQKFPLYVDYSKSYVVSGNIIRIADKKNVTQERMARSNSIDVGRIPLEDALLLGSPTAKTRVIVFTDPECPYCRKLHAELKQVVAADPQIAFYIKLFPLAMHPNADSIARSIVCAHSLELLEASFAGQPVPPPLCSGQEVDDTLKLAAELGIRSTPTLVLPDGKILPGYRQADDLLILLGSDKSVPETPAAKAAVPGQKP